MWDERPPNGRKIYVFELRKWRYHADCIFSSSNRSSGAQMTKIIAMVVLGCCALVFLFIAVTSFEEQLVTALIFAALSTFLAYQAGSILRVHLRQEKTGCAQPGKQDLPQISFVPHWFVMAALVVTGVIVLGSILWKLMR